MAIYPLRLAGWEQRSIIGSDDQMGGWFAQLWRNGATGSEPPEAWLSAPSSAGLAVRIAAATQAPTGTVGAAVEEACGPHQRG